MSGALRVVRVEPIDDEMPAEVAPGDLLLGMTMVIDEGEKRLVRFEGFEDLTENVTPIATREGSKAEFWLMRDGEIASTEVFVRRPPRKP